MVGGFTYLNFFIGGSMLEFNGHFLVALVGVGLYKVFLSKLFFKKSNYLFLYLFLMGQNQSYQTTGTDLLARHFKKTFFFYGAVDGVTRQLFKTISLIFGGWFIWRPLIKKTSYFGLYSNSRINFMKFF